MLLGGLLLSEGRLRGVNLWERRNSGKKLGRGGEGWEVAVGI